MKSRAKLAVVTATHRPVVVDLYGPWRAEIAERDWDAVHVEGDKGEVVELGDVRRRVWR